MIQTKYTEWLFLAFYGTNRKHTFYNTESDTLPEKITKLITEMSSVTLSKYSNAFRVRSVKRGFIYPYL